MLEYVAEAGALEVSASGEVSRLASSATRIYRPRSEQALMVVVRYDVCLVSGRHEVVRVETPGEALLCRKHGRRGVMIFREASVVTLTERRRHHRCLC